MQVSIATLKDRLSAYVAAAETGEDVVITRHGKPTAKIVPFDDVEARLAKQRKAVESIKALRASLGPTGIITEEIVAWVREDRD